MTNLSDQKLIDEMSIAAEKRWLTKHNSIKKEVSETHDWELFSPKWKDKFYKCKNCGTKALSFIEPHSWDFVSGRIEVTDNLPTELYLGRTSRLSTVFLTCKQTLAMKAEKNGNKQWVIYIIECILGTYYTGITNSPLQRFYNHCRGKAAKYTRSNNPTQYVYLEFAKDKSEAAKREYAIKQMSKDEKTLLINSSQIPPAYNMKVRR